jgi:hypothetical protein
MYWSRGKKISQDDRSFLLTSVTRNRVDLVTMVRKNKRNVYIVTSTNTV